MNTRERGDAFGRYVGLELKGAIVARGLTAKKVAEMIGRADANLNRWLNNKTEIPITVVCEVCEALGIEPRAIVEHAYDRMVLELGELSVVGLKDDYDLVANESINEFPAGDDADYEGGA